MCQVKFKVRFFKRVTRLAQGAVEVKALLNRERIARDFAMDDRRHNGNR